jgi:hypothetical protein
MPPEVPDSLATSGASASASTARALVAAALPSKRTVSVAT